MVPLKQHGRREATPTHEGAGTADIPNPRVPAVLSRNRRLSRRLWIAEARQARVRGCRSTARGCAEVARTARPPSRLPSPWRRRKLPAKTRARPPRNGSKLATHRASMLSRAWQRVCRVPAISSDAARCG
jgi:hypothetical protein